jgi:hypothetical protein
MMKGLPRLLALTCVSAVMLVSCGGDGDDADPGATGVTIDEPADGAEVAVPFSLEFSADDGLGPQATGNHHVHVFFDGDESNYEIVEETSFEVTGLSPGEHTITVSLRNADHSAAGAEDEITVTVTGGDTTEDDREDDGGYSY